MSRIRPNPDGTKIEHWRPQSRYPTEQLEYRNLLAACMGNEGAPKKMQHCDTFKSDMDLSKNPAEPSHHVEDGIGYKADGSVYSSDPDFDDELNHVLNLNIHFLKTNRKAVLDSFLQSIPRQRVLKRRVLEKWKRDWNGDASIEDLAPYFQVVVFWIEKRLRRV
jgi:uncharacterized protein (TIGR02646 family)